MAKDWASDVRKYAPDADEGVIAGIVRYCGIALQKVDSSLVSFSDPAELARVRNNFLKKKCGLVHSDADLDAAIAAVGETMKADRTKNRVTVYYLLSHRFDMHHLFVKAPKAPAATRPAAAKARAGKAAAGGGGAKVVPLATAAVVAAADAAPANGAAPATDVAPSAVPAARTAESATPIVAATSASFAAMPSVAVATGAGAAGIAASALGHWTGDSSPLGRRLGLFSDGGAGKELRMFAYVALALAAMALIWVVLTHKPAETAAAPVAAPAALPAAAATTEAVPDGAGIMTETRDEKPVIKVYFDTGKAEVAAAFGAEVGTLKAYLDSHAGSSIGVSGYNDPTGNAAANAALSKKRAQAVKTALVAAAIPDAAIELIKPAAATDAAATNAEARRVEVFVK